MKAKNCWYCGKEVESIIDNCHAECGKKATAEFYKKYPEVDGRIQPVCKGKE